MPDEYAAHRRTAGGISYTDVGEGPVTLFVHGVFTNGRLWRNCFRLLADHRRCIAVDLPGHGSTPRRWRSPQCGACRRGPHRDRGAGPATASTSSATTPAARSHR